jgi:hypothetical protein
MKPSFAKFKLLVKIIGVYFLSLIAIIIACILVPIIWVMVMGGFIWGTYLFMKPEDKR